MRTAAGTGHGPRIEELVDERDAAVRTALDMIIRAFPEEDRQPMEELRSEIAEKRMGLLTAFDSHLFAALDADDHVRAAVTGIYLEGVNAGFINYLVVDADYRGRGLARGLRDRLLDQFRQDARHTGQVEPAWVLGEVRPDNPWLAGLIRAGQAIPFDLTYYHPGPTGHDERFVLYRQPMGDARESLPVDLVRRVLYAVWRRVYRIRYPLERPGFLAMLETLKGRDEIGPAYPDDVS